MVGDLFARFGAPCFSSQPTADNTPTLWVERDRLFLLLAALDGAEQALLIDALDGPGAPGALRRIDPAELAADRVAKIVSDLKHFAKQTDVTKSEQKVRGIAYFRKNLI